MKIIKEGNPKMLKGIKSFECKKCGCVFEAEKDEYGEDSQYNRTYYYCRCPFCECMAFEQLTRGAGE